MRQNFNAINSYYIIIKKKKIKPKLYGIASKNVTQVLTFNKTEQPSIVHQTMAEQPIGQFIVLINRSSSQKRLTGSEIWKINADCVRFEV